MPTRFGECGRCVLCTELVCRPSPTSLLCTTQVLESMEYFSKILAARLTIETTGALGKGAPT